MSKSNYIPFLERPGKWIRGKFTIIHKQYGESYPYDIVPRWMEEYDLLIEFYNICKKIYQICNPNDEDEIVFDVPREEVEEDIQFIYVPNEYMHRFIQEFNEDDNDYENRLAELCTKYPVRFNKNHGDKFLQYMKKYVPKKKWIEFNRSCSYNREPLTENILFHNKILTFCNKESILKKYISEAKEEYEKIRPRLVKQAVLKPQGGGGGGGGVLFEEGDIE